MNNVNEQYLCHSCNASEESAFEPVQLELDVTVDIDIDIDDAEQKVKQRIYNVIDEREMNYVYALFSGGHDSLCSTYLVSQHPKFAGVVHIDTGIGIPDVQEYVKDTCNTYGWDLSIYKATDITLACGEKRCENYDYYVKRFGFPGPKMHSLYYSRLKERSLNQFYREAKKRHSTKKILLSTGIRMYESKRRFNNYKAYLALDGYQYHSYKHWLNPILDWTDDHKHKLISKYALPKNPVYEYMCKSGECLCGAFAKKGELLILEQHYPEVYKRLMRLYEEIKHKFPWHWDERPKHYNKGYKQGE